MLLLRTTAPRLVVRGPGRPPCSWRALASVVPSPSSSSPIDAPVGTPPSPSHQATPASAATRSDYSRLPLGDARALPFRISAKQARDAINAYYAKQYLARSSYFDRDGKGRELRSVYVPFHVFEATTGRVELSGEIGRNRQRKKYDAATNTYKSTQTTTWTPSGLYYTDGSKYDPSMEDMQVRVSVADGSMLN